MLNCDCKLFIITATITTMTNSSFQGLRSKIAWPRVINDEILILLTCNSLQLAAVLKIEMVSIN